MKRHTTSKNGTIAGWTVGALLPIATLALPGLGLTVSCKPQKKQEAATPETPVQEPEGTPPPPSGPDPKVVNDGHGTQPSPSLQPTDFEPSESPNPQSGNALAQQMNQVNELISSFDFQLKPYSGLENYQASPHEMQAEGCLNDYLARSKFVRRNTDGHIEVETLNPSIFSECLKTNPVQSATGKTATFGTNFYFSCSGTEPTGPNLDGLPTTAPEWTKRYCESGQSASVRYEIRIQAKETGQNGETLRSFRRLKALSSRSGQECSWDYQPAQQLRVFKDCVFIERIDNNDSTSSLFVSVEFSNVTARVFQGGMSYVGGTAKVRFNNFTGTITFQENGAHTWSLKEEGTDKTQTGIISSNSGTLGQAIAPNPAQYPYGTSYEGAKPLSYTPVTSADNGREITCSPLVSAQNIEIGGGLGNGAVSQFRTVHPSGAIFHAGYVYDDATGTRKPFIAQIANNVLVWCRTYMVQNIGTAQGVWIGDIGAAQYYAAFVADQPSFAPVGQAFQATRPPEQKAVIYLAQFDPATGNVLAGSWFDILQTPGASFSTVLLDAAGLSRGQVRLRAYMSNNQGPGCPRVASGNYGIVLRGDLSGLATTNAEFCP